MNYTIERSKNNKNMIKIIVPSNEVHHLVQEEIKKYSFDKNHLQVVMNLLLKPIIDEEAKKNHIILHVELDEFMYSYNAELMQDEMVLLVTYQKEEYKTKG